MELIDRHDECRQLDDVLSDVRSGRGRALVLVGEPGVGKSLLMEYVAEQAVGCRALHAAGVESEMELAYSALHQVCAPMLNHLEGLPIPQRDALSTAFGLNVGPAPDRLLIGLAVLGLFSEVAEEQPLVCFVDDFQWIDTASAQMFSFLARRLRADSVALFVATRTHSPDLAGLPTLVVSGLRQADARALLDVVWTARLDERVRDQIVAETGGNPLALLELPRDLTEHELAGGFGMPGAVRLSGRIEESFQRRLDSLPQQTRRLLLIAAAEPTGDPTLVWRAAAMLGVSPDAAPPALLHGLAEFGLRVRFRHPLVRSATYQSAPLAEKQLVHQALAETTDPQTDPDRRAWHRAHAARGPDEGVAAELERSADRAQARGGLAAAGAFLERATMLTLDSRLRAQRALAAASALVQAGGLDAALRLLAVAENEPLSDHESARADLIRAQLAYVSGRGSDAPPLLLKAAERLAPIDPGLSRTTYLQALQAAIFAGRLALGGGVLDVARAAQAAPTPPVPSLTDLLLDGLAAYFTSGYAAGLPILRRAVAVARGDVPDHERAFLWLAGIAALHIWDDEGWDAVSARHLALARAAGALTELPLALSSRAVMLTFAGELTAAGLLLQELRSATEATGDSLATDPAMSLAAFRGSRAEAEAMIASTTNDVIRRGEGIWLSVAEWSQAVLDNGIGHHDAALPAARKAAEQNDMALSAWATVELVESAVHSGAMDTAVDVVARLSEWTSASGTPWALGVEARSRALISNGTQADTLYRDAIEHLGHTRMRIELARTHLLYGEWLRAARRRDDARVQLRTAHQIFEAMGMQAFTERAARGLSATGEPAREHIAETVRPELTEQELQVAHMAAAGLTNPEIGARLFISAKTVQYHLSKVFAKLSISSRGQLDHVLQQPPTATQSE